MKNNNWLYILNIVALLLFIALLYGILSHSQSLIYLDQSVKDFVESIQLPWLTLLMIIITNTYIFLPIIIGILLYKRKRINSVWLLISLIIGTILELSIKLIIGRSRPPNTLIEINPIIEIYGYSFPSGHAVIAVISFLILAVSFKGLVKGFISNLFLKWGSLLAVIAILFSRLYLNAHWLSDVMGGIFLALFIVSSVYLIFQIFGIKIEV